MIHPCPFFFFFNDTATTEIYTLSLHDALPISFPGVEHADPEVGLRCDAVADSHADVHESTGTERLEHGVVERRARRHVDRKSTRLNSSHVRISYAVFCLKKKRE